MHVRELVEESGRPRYRPSRKRVETLRRWAASYQWAFQGAGGPFTFAHACDVLGLDERLVRDKLVRITGLTPDINTTVAWILRHPERTKPYPDDLKPVGRIVNAVAEHWGRT